MINLEALRHKDFRIQAVNLAYSVSYALSDYESKYGSITDHVADFSKDTSRTLGVHSIQNLFYAKKRDIHTVEIEFSDDPHTHDPMALNKKPVEMLLKYKDFSQLTKPVSCRISWKLPYSKRPFSRLDGPAIISLTDIDTPSDTDFAIWKILMDDKVHTSIVKGNSLMPSHTVMHYINDFYTRHRIVGEAGRVN